MAASVSPSPSKSPSVGSSSLIVPMACASASEALAGFERLTKKVSFGSNNVSPLTCTVKVPTSEPAGILPGGLYAIVLVPRCSFAPDGGASDDLTTGVLEHCGHFSTEEAPEALVQRILQHIAARAG